MGGLTNICNAAPAIAGITATGPYDEKRPARPNRSHLLKWLLMTTPESPAAAPDKMNPRVNGHLQRRHALSSLLVYSLEHNTLTRH